MIKRKISESKKKEIAGKQRFKCANKPNSKLKGMGDYKCHLWKLEGDDKGSFDETGYDIDHIEEFSVSHNDNDENLQALCGLCHRIKTRNFMRTINKKKKYDNSDNSDNELNNGYDQVKNKKISTAKFKCPNCPYKTNKQDNYNKHVNRKNSCKKNKKIHGNTRKEKENTYCEICDRNFTREDSLKRHNKTYHSEINSKVDCSAINQPYCNMKTGDNTIHGNNNTIKQTNNNININAPIIIQQIIHIHPKNTGKSFKEDNYESSNEDNSESDELYTTSSNSDDDE